MYRPLLHLALFVVLTVGIGAQNANVVGSTDITPPARSTLRARVFYEDTGRPVKRMSVILFSKERSREAYGVTDANGGLVIKNLPAGKYYALVNAPGVVTPLAYVDFRRSTSGESLEDQFRGFPAIEINGMTDVAAEIPARRGGAIGGRVTYSDGDSAIGVKVEILRKVGDEYLPTIPNLSAVGAMERMGSGMAQTDDRGMYRFPGLPAGEYLVKVTENVQHSPEPQRSYYGADPFMAGGSLLSVFFENAFLKEKAQTVTVQFGQEIGEINITIPDRDLHFIAGKIVSATDKLPIRGAELSIRREGDVSNEGGIFSNRPQIVHSDANGIWKFSDLPGGTYKMAVDAENAEFDEVARAYGRDPSAPYNAANTASYGQGRKEKPPSPKFAKTVKEFNIEDNDLSEQIVELAFGGTLIGTVSIDAAKDDPGSVSLSAFNEKSDSFTTTSVSFYDYNPNGRVIVKSREFRLEAIAAGENSINISTDRDYYVKSAESSQIDLLKGPIEVKSGETLANIKIVLASDTGTLKGTVIDDERQPIAGYDLWLVPTDSEKFRTSTFFRYAKTDDKGEFEIKLPPFEYAVVSLEAKTDVKTRNEWLANAIKRSPAFKIEAGKITKASIKGEKKKN